MTLPDQPDEFERALQRRTRLLPPFEAELDGPDAETDRIVLARAREPFTQTAREPRYHRAPRWALPVALAATLLLSFTLVLHMGGRDAGARRESGVLLDERAATASATTDAAADAADAPPAEVATEPQREPRAEAMQGASVAASVARSAPSAVTAPTAPIALPAAPPPPPALAAAPPVAAPVATPTIAAAKAAPAVADAAMAAEQAAPRAETPADWLARIETLRTAGDLDAARRELAAFRRKYPDAPLPEPLRGL